MAGEIMKASIGSLLARLTDRFGRSEGAPSNCQKRLCFDNRAPSILAIGLALSVVPAIAAAAASSGSSEQALLERAKHWQAKNRPDLAADALDKVLAIDPG